MGSDGVARRAIYLLRVGDRDRLIVAKTVNP
jgi:hypothetical protein